MVRSQITTEAQLIRLAFCYGALEDILERHEGHRRACKIPRNVRSVIPTSLRISNPTFT